MTDYYPDDNPAPVQGAQEVGEPRAVVQRFARLMETKLSERDARYGEWTTNTLGKLLRDLLFEVGELALEVSDEYPTPDLVAREAADVANFAMMIADVCAERPSRERGRVLP